MNRTISKSKYLAGLQCPKLLWHHFNRRDAFPPVDAATQAIFDAGHQVGDLAKRLYPDGVEVPMDFADLGRTAAATSALLPARRPIFEASFLDDGVYCRADILVPADGDAWDLIEVKSGTGVKPQNLADVAFQARLAERARVKLRRLHLMHIDASYVRRGAVDPAGLFHRADVTDEARALQAEVPAQIADMRGVIAGDCPDTPLGPHCKSPHPCDLWPMCSAHLPEHPVLELYRARKEAVFALIDRGVLALTDAPADALNGKQLIQQRTVASGRAHVEPGPLRAWLEGLAYPLHCLDFETVAAAVPLYDGTGPYQQVPFQFSLHVVESEGAAPRHLAYLAETAEDPRPGLIEALRGIGPTGTILAFNTVFERGVLRELAAGFPGHAAFLDGLDDRFSDLLTPFRNFWYHHPQQRGSCSLKHVLPALTGRGYAGMAIADGNQAMREFQRAVFGDVDAAEKRRVLEGLREYCEQDTQALLEVLGVLSALAPR
ncbi:DUF2779 domain-containing protein [bacterium]|nr:DUF2779 domain-containing protein [bacterium]MBU1675706.1 DUF2779 domain-containing protein [bacterium]